MAPRIDHVEGLEVRIYSHDHGPPHVHVSIGGADLRVCLDDERGPEYAHGRMKGSDERRAVKLVRERREQYVKKWEEVGPQ